MADMPITVRVGPHDYTIHVMPSREMSIDDANGSCTPDLLEVKIDGDLEGTKLVEVLIHELLHACWAEGAIADEVEEEEAVTVLGKMLTGMFRDNPTLVSFISETLEAVR